jgi:predicted GNAT family acetyltransferase
METITSPPELSRRVFERVTHEELGWLLREMKSAISLKRWGTEALSIELDAQGLWTVQVRGAVSAQRFVAGGLERPARNVQCWTVEYRNGKGKDLQLASCRLMLDADTAYVSNVLVGWYCRGQGVGSRMMEMVASQADEQQWVMWLNCSTEMSTWYERLGFVVEPDPLPEYAVAGLVAMRRLPPQWAESEAV